MENISAFKFFVLSGLQDLGVYKPLYFMLTLILYALIVTANVTLILNVSLEKSLHEPMYIFICNLCTNGLYGTAGFYPKFMMDLLSDFHTITYGLCCLQIYIIYTSALCEITILTVMSYDRYVAICKPLQYHSILTPHTVMKLLLFAWSYPLLTALVGIMLTVRIPICGSVIHKVFCDNPSVLKLGCFQSVINQIWSVVLITVQIIQFAFIFISYCQIIHVCVSSSEGRAKFVKTCLPHILVMFIFAITALFDVLYSWGGSRLFSVRIRNALAVQFLILPPLLNPIIYGFQLPQIRKMLFRQSCKHNIMC